MWKYKPDALRTIREVRGLTQTGAAEKMGISHRQQWDQWEKGKVGMSVNTMLEICNKFGCSPSYFFVSDDENIHQQGVGNDK